jgi:hypothetical protein
MSPTLNREMAQVLRPELDAAAKVLVLRRRGIGRRAWI